MPWNRLEYHGRAGDIEPGLQARVADPLWMLARQWQFGEFQGEDAGSPVGVSIAATVAKVSGFRGTAGDPEVFTEMPDAPVEALVENEPIITGPAALRLAADAAMQFFRVMEGQGIPTTMRATLRNQYPLFDAGLHTATLLTPAEQRFLDVLLRSSFDARQLFDSAQPTVAGGPPVVPAVLGLTGSQLIQFQTALDEWYLWYGARFTEFGGTRWRSERMEYDAELLARVPTEDISLQATGYGDGRLEWSDFTLASVVLDPTADFVPPDAVDIDRIIIPGPVRYRGMPVSRFWEFEDHRVYLGDIDAGPTDLVRMMLLEFALLAADDWFQVPLDLPVGSLTRIDSLEVADTFGVRKTLLSTVETDGVDVASWRMFTLAGDPALVNADVAPWLFLVPSVAKSLESSPVEDVAFLRDEMANMAWAVERKVEGPTGLGSNRFERWVAQRQPEPTGSTDELSYQLSTRVPDHWFPLVPVQNPPNSIRLRRGALLRSPNEPVLVPLGRVLEPDGALRLHEEEVPRAGMRVTRSWQLARWHDGSTWLWMGRRKQLGRPERASNLKFDQIRSPQEGE